MVYYCPRCKAVAKHEPTDDPNDKSGYKCPKCGQEFILLGI